MKRARDICSLPPIKTPLQFGFTCEPAEYDPASDTLTTRVILPRQSIDHVSQKSGRNHELHQHQIQAHRSLRPGIFGIFWLAMRLRDTPESYSVTMPCQTPSLLTQRTHSDMRLPDLERGSLPDAAGTDEQNRSNQRLKQTTV